MGNDSPEAKDATKPCESSSVPGRVGVADPEPDRLPPPCPPEIKLCIVNLVSRKNVCGSNFQNYLVYTLSTSRSGTFTSGTTS